MYVIPRDMISEKDQRAFNKVTLPYFDVSYRQERSLLALAELCQGVDAEHATQDVLEYIGESIKEYLDKKWVYDHFFLGRSIENLVIDDVFTKAEIYILDEKYPSNKPSPMKLVPLEHD